MNQIRNLPDGSTKAEERRRKGFVWSTLGPVGTEEEHRDRGTGAQPRVSCGAPKHRQGIGPKNGTKEHLPSALLVRPSPLVRALLDDKLHYFTSKYTKTSKSSVHCQI
jgi:hypothetical protein